MRGLVIILVLMILIAGILIFSDRTSRHLLSEDVMFDSLVVVKKNRVLLAYADGHVAREYRMSLGSAPAGPKQFEGDGRTPEGVYFIDSKNAYSGYHKNLGISYPNKQDAQKARLLKRPPGGSIKIHGLRNGLGFVGRCHRLIDWTRGCIAVTNEEIDELYVHTPVGTRIVIRPK
jgi:murein L,D-transpeptidase YafK